MILQLYKLSLDRPISQLSYRVTGQWISFPKGKETPVLHLRIPKTLQKTLVGINYLELFLISKNIYMKHECQNIILKL